MTDGTDPCRHEAERTPAQVEPNEALRLALGNARWELLDAAALIPDEERTTRAVCGTWTLKDLLGHIADWERVGMEGLRLMAAGHAPTVEHIEDIEAWNQAHALARQDQLWEVVWADLNTIQRELLEILAGMDAPLLCQSFPFPWGGEGTAYDWVSVFEEHDREHAADLQAAGAFLAGEAEA